jgi:nucleoid DNA-binding protein
MTITELVGETRRRLSYEISHKQAKELLMAAFDVIMETTGHGEDVRIRNFAQFSTYRQGKHRVYCGIIGEWRMAKQHLRIKLKASRKWRDALKIATEG